MSVDILQICLLDPERANVGERSSAPAVRASMVFKVGKTFTGSEDDDSKRAEVLPRAMKVMVHNPRRRGLKVRASQKDI